MDFTELPKDLKNAFIQAKEDCPDLNLILEDTLENADHPEEFKQNIKKEMIHHIDQARDAIGILCNDW